VTDLGQRDGTDDADLRDASRTDADHRPLVGRRGLGGRLYHGETAIDFYGRRWWGLVFSAMLIVVTLGSLAIRQLNLGLDFEGGVAWEVPSGAISPDEARDILDDNGVDGDSAKILQRSSAAGDALLIQTDDQALETREAVQTALAAAAGIATDDVSTSSVSSTWGRSVTEKAVRALVIFLVLVALFLAWRLEWRMAVGALVAVVHDVLITVGVYSLLGFEVTPATVVAFLTILGFSLYDSIVVFDKMKENGQRYLATKLPYADVLNVSMNQVLMRSLNTSLAAILPVLSLLVLGAGILGAVTLREFALSLLVGLLAGSYSSIFVASPIVALLKERELRYRAQRGRHATGAELERLVLGGMPVTSREVRGRRRSTAGSTPVPALAGVGGASASASAEPPTTSAPPVPTGPAPGLPHPPRPRKKRRR